jgi:hypothetical protein
MAILFSSEIDDGLRVEGYEPRIIKRRVATVLKELETEPYEYCVHHFFYNGRECAVWFEHMGDYIYIEHIIFNILRPKK